MKKEMNNSMLKKYDVIIIGAGPAGLFTAMSINNKNVLVLEKNCEPGRKILISGAGQCNYTNSCDIENFINKYGDNGRFLKPALYNFSNRDTIDFFKTEGIDSIVREDKKVFPSSLKSRDILNVLLNKCKRKSVEIRYDASVNDIQYDKTSRCFVIKAKDHQFVSTILVIATGGKSYISTGSTGDGYIFAKNLGHKIVDTAPALAPVYVENYEFSELSGISFQNISITLWRDNKKINQFLGDLLFTHKNLSGPVIINNSRYILKGDILKINFTQYINNDEFRMNFEQKVFSSGKCNLKTLIRELNMPKRFVDKIMELGNVSDDKICSELDKKSRKKIIELLSNYSMVVQSIGDFNVAMVTRGGVSTSEISSKTMESKIIDNLYFVGEVLDIDGDTGGYNIQAAFSTGKLAGDSINSNEHSKCYKK
ncbi:putative Rossmann fold flavoprotein [Sedimentibacter acidaminivorans]|uniref:Rossmann fold flavoprotein n=1 Tax=Sedimentibacter acidaminivorans TaxID=913099 RepID=A0ABS4GFW1_9FIRM|nr:NAD(P)/FAD-dependent oxidoreductase [Sedimentibacter acidaminivorans]MBP1926427.1 putative Rossmann fold flavoprotein [Sedimentibacter acidaminivorans]